MPTAPLYLADGSLPASFWFPGRAEKRDAARAKRLLSEGKKTFLTAARGLPCPRKAEPGFDSRNPPNR
jgi:hypothetical protein